MVRNIENYLYKTNLVRDGFSGTEDEYVALPMLLQLEGETGTLSVEVWRNKTAFNNSDFAEKSLNLSKNLPITQTVIQNYSTLFDLVKSKSLEFLSVSADEYFLQSIAIDLNSLQVRLQAQHKTKANRKVFDSTATVDEFNELKANYPEIVEAFYGFAFDYMATNENLSKFE